MVSGSGSASHLLAQYFPELDRYYGHSESENLAIVRWCLSPSKIAKMKYENFFRLVTTRERGLAQHQRLKAIWDHAHYSIGCPAGTAAAFEAEVLVEALKLVREIIGSTEKKEVFKPEYLKKE
jgi:hypothetical protein